jgi:hypothetical protein
MKNMFPSLSGKLRNLREMLSMFKTCCCLSVFCGASNCHRWKQLYASSALDVAWQVAMVSQLEIQPVHQNSGESGNSQGIPIHQAGFFNGNGCPSKDWIASFCLPSSPLLNEPLMQFLGKHVIDFNFKLFASMFEPPNMVKTDVKTILVTILPSGKLT